MMSVATSRRRLSWAEAAPPDPQHRLGQGDAQLDHHHALCLIQLERREALAEGQVLLPHEVLLLIQQDVDRHLGERQGLRQARRGQWAGTV
jgi:hypothetical protein